jgi:two-component system, LuxR family, sensor histidine kinase DctS
MRFPLEKWLRTKRQVMVLVAVCVLLYGAITAALFALALQAERNSEQAALDADGDEINAQLKSRLTVLQNELGETASGSAKQTPAQAFERAVAGYSELQRLELRDASLQLRSAANAPRTPPNLALRPELPSLSVLACTAASKLNAPQYSNSYFVPTAGGEGMEIIDYCIATGNSGGSGKNEPQQYWIASISLSELMKLSYSSNAMRHGEVSLSDADGSRLATAARGPRGRVYAQSIHTLALPGATFLVGVSSRLSPTLPRLSAFALVAGAFSLLLFASVMFLARDVLRRQRAESALSAELALRRAMEDSTITGLRARDLSGRITYVNPAFCELTGLARERLLGATPPMPYWPPDAVPEHEQRLARRKAGQWSREVFETEFQMPDGTRKWVQVYEAPLLDAKGVHTGWMASMQDVTEQRAVEEVARTQQDKLAETSRLVTVGELASTLSHELNQPLGAIASLAAAARNMAASEPPAPPELMREVLGDLSTQAERAGRVVRSIHGFVKRGERKRERLDLKHLIEELSSLFELQARTHQARFELDLPNSVFVKLERTLFEQVILNLSRNGFEAMAATPRHKRVLRITLSVTDTRALVCVIDAGPGVSQPESLAQPFFTTKPNGMGMGLSICRSVLEQYGGELIIENIQGQNGVDGARFCCEVPLMTGETL